MMRKQVNVIIFWGALWGLAEATLGYLLHMLPMNIGWLVWFPLALYFMNKIYGQTGKPISVFFTSCLAAAIKLVNLFMPVRIDKVLNPAVSILLEGLVVFAAYKLFEKRETLKHKYSGILSLSMSWRLLYILYILPMPDWMVKISPISGIIPFTRFILIESLINSIVIYAYIILNEKLSRSAKKNEPGSITPVSNVFKQKLFNPDILKPTKPLLPFSLLAAAILVQWVL